MKKANLPPLAGELRALFDAARTADEPNELARARVRRGVEVQLAAGAGAMLAGSGVALAGVLKAVVVAGAIAGATGAGLYVRAHRAHRPPAPVERIVAAAPRPTVAPPPPALAPPPPPPIAARPSRRHARPLAAPIAAPAAGGGRSEVHADLAEEVRLLGAANSALARHDVPAARARLDEYDRRPGVGVLAEEREVAGILASCAEGQVDAARAEVRRFHARWPRSPLLARVDGSCAGDRVTGRATP